MKDVAKSYYTTERLPKDLNESKKMTLQEMLDNKLILPLMDSNGKYCDKRASYVEITKLENEYVIKVYLSCSDKQDYIIEHFGCYDICSDTCKLLETTTTTEAEKTRAAIGTRYKTTAARRYTTRYTYRPTVTRTTLTSKPTTAPTVKIYEYEFVKNICTEEFDKYVCPTGYDLIEDSCVKENSRTIVYPSEKIETTITSIDTKPAKQKTVIVDDDGNIIDDGTGSGTGSSTGSGTQIVDAICGLQYVTSTVNANPSTQEINATKTITTTDKTADAIIATDTKPAYATTKRVTIDYISSGTYDIITATKTATSSRWLHDYVTISPNSNLAYTNETEKLMFIRAFEEEECPECTTSHGTKKYEYWHFTKQYTYSYTCPEGYSKYGETTCKSNTASGSSKVCPSGYNPDGAVCSRQETYYDEKNACSSYGSGYTLNKSKGTCTKTTTKGYNCPKGTPIDGGKKCRITSTEYSCPAGYNEKSGDKTKCTKTTYSCPANTSSRTYTLNGSKCTLKRLVNACTCPAGTVKSDTVGKCIKSNKTKVIYTCEDYDGYELTDTDKCVKEIKTTTIVQSCEKYGNDFLLDEKAETCTKTVNEKDTIPAEKTYKPLCEQHYLWSTKTEIEGWSYTGNKRLLNK